MDSLKSLKITLPYPPFSNLETRFLASGFAYTPKEKKDWMKTVARSLDPFTGHFAGVLCIKAKFLFVIDRPKTHPPYIPSGIWKTMTSFYKPSRPDTDNYVKPLQDSMGNAILESIKQKLGPPKKSYGAGIIDDDSNIVDLRAIKIYCQPGQEPHIKIKLTELPLIYEPDNY